MEIANMSLTRLRNDAHFQFHTEIKDLVALEKPETLGIKPMFDTYLSALDREDEALKKIVKSALTQKINEADAARDKVYGAMCDLVGVMVRHFNPQIADAAARVKVVLETYGNVSRKPLNEQTSAVYNLLQELDLPKFRDDCINISINPWRNELKNCNEDFERLTKERVSETVAKTEIVLKDARRAVDDAYRAIVKRINAAIEMEGQEKYVNFVKYVNANIAKYNVKHHRHRHHAGGGEEETSDGE